MHYPRAASGVAAGGDPRQELAQAGGEGGASDDSFHLYTMVVRHHNVTWYSDLQQVCALPYLPLALALPIPRRKEDRAHVRRLFPKRTCWFSNWPPFTLLQLLGLCRRRYTAPFAWQLRGGLHLQQVGFAALAYSDLLSHSTQLVL